MGTAPDPKDAIEVDLDLAQIDMPEFGLVADVMGKLMALDVSEGRLSTDRESRKARVDLMRGFLMADGSLRVIVDGLPFDDILVPKERWRQVSTEFLQAAGQSREMDQGLLDDIAEKIKGMADEHTAWREKHDVLTSQAKFVGLVIDKSGRGLAVARDICKEFPPIAGSVTDWLKSDDQFYIGMMPSDEADDEEEGGYFTARDLSELTEELLPHLFRVICTPPDFPALTLAVSEDASSAISLAIKQLMPSIPGVSN